MNPDRQVQIATLIAIKAFVTILAEYLNFEDIFFKKSAVILPKYTKINTYTINPEEGNKSSYKFIYSLKLMELKILKTYIEINLANDFIHSSKSPVSASILFEKKFNRNL